MHSQHPTNRRPPLPTQLRAGQTRVIQAHGGLQLQVTAGRLWLTQTGDGHDHFLPAGSVTWLQGGHIVVEADGPRNGSQPVAAAYVLSALTKPAPLTLQAGTRWPVVHEAGQALSSIRKGLNALLACINSYKFYKNQT